MKWDCDPTACFALYIGGQQVEIDGNVSELELNVPAQNKLSALIQSIRKKSGVESVRAEVNSVSTSVKNSRLLLLLKRMVYNQCMLSKQSYEAATLGLTKRFGRKLGSTQRVMERRVGE